MNRTDAVRELEQTIEWMMATFFEGRCPKCEALGKDDDTVMLQTSGGPHGEQRIYDYERIKHVDSCPCRQEVFFDRAGYLCERFGLEVEFAPERRDDKSYYGPRFVRERGQDRDPVHLFLIGADRYTHKSHDGTWHEATGEEL